MKERSHQAYGRYDQVLEGEMLGREFVEAGGWNGFGIATIGSILSLTAFLLYTKFIQRGRVTML